MKLQLGEKSKVKGLKQACHLDILMKTQGEKTKTQEQKTQNSRAKNQKLKDSLKTLKILENLSIFIQKVLLSTKFFQIRNIS